MKRILFLIFVIVLLMKQITQAQILIDLSEVKTSTEPIDLNVKPILMVRNLLPNSDKYIYSISINLKEEEIPAIS
jgi:hypothetical protein